MDDGEGQSQMVKGLTINLDRCIASVYAGGRSGHPIHFILVLLRYSRPRLGQQRAQMYSKSTRFKVEPLPTPATA